MNGHKHNGEFCECGADCCTCQICGQRVCSSQTNWKEKVGNVCRDVTNCHVPLSRIKTRFDDVKLN